MSHETVIPAPSLFPKTSQKPEDLPGARGTAFSAAVFKRKLDCASVVILQRGILLKVWIPITKFYQTPGVAPQRAEKVTEEGLCSEGSRIGLKN